MSDKSKRGDWEQWIAACLDNQHKLTDWEIGFIDSIEEQLSEGRNLSQRQAEILERIYAEKTP